MKILKHINLLKKFQFSVNQISIKILKIHFTEKKNNNTG